MNGVNLIPPSRRHAAKARGRARVWGVILGVYAAGALGIGSSFALSASRGGTEVDLSAERSRQRMERAEKQLGEARTLRDGAVKALEIGRAVGVHPDWSVLLSALAKECGREVVLERIELGVSGGAAAGAVAAGTQKKAGVGPASSAGSEFTMKIGGLAASQGAVSDFVTALEGMGVFDSVIRAEARARTDVKTRLVWFEVRCVVRDAGGAAAGAKGGPG